MRHLILDDDLKFDPRYRTYRFYLEDGNVTDYFKGHPGVELNLDYTCVPDTFRVIKSKSSGQWRIVPGEDRTQRALVMCGANTNTRFERPEIDTQETLCQIIASYDINSSTNGLKIIAIMAPRKPLFVKFTNIATKAVRYDVFLYNAYSHVVETSHLSEADYSNLHKDKVILYDYDMSMDLIKSQGVNGMTPDQLKIAKEWHTRYHSFTHDKVLCKW